MAGLTLAQRDFAATQRQLGRWFSGKFDQPATVSLTVANASGGWSSESLLASVSTAQGTHEYIVRIPPAGGGLFADYDLEGQTRTQDLVRGYGVTTPSPLHYEPDTGWIGSKFLVMPRILGHIPGDMTYARKGWLHDATVDVQRRAHDGFLSTLAALQRVPPDRAPWLQRPTGTGTAAEVTWWREYALWGTDNDVPDLMLDAFDWLAGNLPNDEAEPALCWGDARMSNMIFDDQGNIVGVLDWEQACLCPAEADFGWWLATRRQMLAVHGIDADPELPGFDSRSHVIDRYQDMIGRRLNNLDWYENFATVRIGCCTLRIQVLLRALGQHDHFLTRAPILPPWTVDAIRSGRPRP
ncbi:phosphotransferase family protein [Mycobacterium sp. 94-17]|uniref:phosphotransferase family protein n=1 Tax=Mycobacterium sp. 94-17 TaxID=2986147 RepID=UPI002D1F2D71|nr:phosphotransferase family protein [Mycobacterium sp. 94-17]MEB4208028.1 phosphotransferase family protein [Mycobacterium sp. 94-17]